MIVNEHMKISSLKKIQSLLNDYKNFNILDSELFRRLIDRWFCYSRGYVDKNGKHNWNSVVGSEWVSVGYIQNPKGKIVKVEHIVPLKLILDKLISLESFELEHIEEILIKFYHVASISKEEDDILRSLKLGSSMPSEFYDPKSELYDDIFARYKKVGLELSKIVVK